MSAIRVGRWHRGTRGWAFALVAMLAGGLMTVGCSSKGPGEELGGAVGEMAGSSVGEKSIKPPEVGKVVGASAGRTVGEAAGKEADD